MAGAELPDAPRMAQEAPPEPVIRVRDLAARFGGRTIFEHVSFEVRRGEVFVILGGSGCGKSTLLKHMIGLYDPAEGGIEILGQDIAALQGEARQALQQGDYQRYGERLAELDRLMRELERQLGGQGAPGPESGEGQAGR